MNNIDDEEFNKILETIDERLGAENYGIHAREIMANIELAKVLGLSNRGIVIAAPLYLNNIKNDFSERISQWYRRRYGIKLNYDRICGQMIITFNGIPYKAIFPIIYGRVKIVPEKFIQDITPQLKLEIAKGKINDQLKLYIDSFNAIQKYVNLNFTYWEMALADLICAVDLYCRGEDKIMMSTSKWSSLQFTEKIIKGLIIFKGRKHNKNHKLKDLAIELKTCDQINIDEDLIDQIICRGSIRYDQCNAMQLKLKH